MNVLYLDCSMGAAGDMLTAALYELLDEKQKQIYWDTIKALNLPGVEVAAEQVAKCGILGTHMSVKIQGHEEAEHEHAGIEHTGAEHAGHEHAGHEHAGIEHTGAELACHEHTEHEQAGAEDACDEHTGAEHAGAEDACDEHTGAELACHEKAGVEHAGHEHQHGHEHHHHHASMHHIEEVIGALPVAEKVKEDALAVYGLIAQAESHAHGKPVTEIHFHEVGTLDAVVDVTSVCLLMQMLAPDKVVASPVHVGSGHVHCAHGILPVPAPATAYILQDVPTYGGAIQGELCTPTGAALLKHFVTEFGSMPLMTVRHIGYGMGLKDFPQANCVRALWGTVEQGAGDRVVELSCNVDDMTGEEIGFAMECLFEAGAMDVFTVPIGMKKSRPGIMLSVIGREEDKELLVRTLFLHTTTLGVRETNHPRYILRRSTKQVETSLGSATLKVSEGYGITRAKFEYEDVARIAREQGMSFRETAARLAAENGDGK